MNIFQRWANQRTNFLDRTYEDTIKDMTEKEKDDFCRTLFFSQFMNQND